MSVFPLKGREETDHNTILTEKINYVGPTNADTQTKRHYQMHYLPLLRLIIVFNYEVWEKSNMILLTSTCTLVCILVFKNPNPHALFTDKVCGFWIFAIIG